MKRPYSLGAPIYATTLEEQEEIIKPVTHYPEQEASPKAEANMKRARILAKAGAIPRAQRLSPRDAVLAAIVSQTPVVRLGYGWLQRATGLGNEDVETAIATLEREGYLDRLGPRTFDVLAPAALSALGVKAA